MRTFSPRERNLFVCSLAIIALFFIFKFIAKPWGEYSAGLKEQIESAQEMLKRNQNIIQKAKEKESYQSLGRAVSKEAEFKTVNAAIENLAKNGNIHLIKVQNQQDSIKGMFHVFPVEVEFDGAWGDVHRFLYTLQNSPNSFVINELNLVKSDDKIQVQMTLTKESLINK